MDQVQQPSPKRNFPLFSLTIAVLSFIVLVLLGFILFMRLPSLLTLIYPDQQTSPVIDKLRAKTGQTMSAQDYKTFLLQVAQVAQPTTQIEVKNCQLSPRVVKASSTTTLEWKNSGDTTIFLTITDKRIRVEAHQTASTALSFLKTSPVAYGIGCNGERQASGILYLTE